jgi:uncharacterized protein YcnI
MTRTSLWLPRALSVGAAATTLYLGSLAGMATASAHVHVDAESPVRGSTTVLTFQVPNESETGSATTSFTVALPNVGSARTDVLPGWTAKLDEDTAAGTARSVTWTAVPGAGIPPDQFEMFQMTVKLPDADTVSFPATQTYADGLVVHWDQQAAPGAAEPEYPAPTLQLTAAGAPMPDQHGPAAAPAQSSAPAAIPAPPAAEQPRMGADNIARALGGGAILVAALGTGIALVRRGT